MTTYVASQEFGGTIKVGVLHAQSETGQSADLDVVCIVPPNTVHVIECKGKGLGVTVSLAEVEGWLGELSVMQDYLASERDLRGREQNYAFWTTGRLEADARARLEQERRIKNPIPWKEGKDVGEMAARLQFKAIGDALNEHFLLHPLSRGAAWQGGKCGRVVLHPFPSASVGQRGL